MNKYTKLINKKRMIKIYKKFKDESKNDKIRIKNMIVIIKLGDLDIFIN